MAKYLIVQNGRLKEQQAIDQTTGAADAAKIIQTDSTGKLHSSFLPSGVGANSKIMTASEALSAGDFVNVFNDAGTAKVRKADNSTNKPANGFVLSAASAGAAVEVYFSGEINNQLSGLSVGADYYLSTAGAVTTTPPTAAGSIVQYLGKAISATEIAFVESLPIELA